ncbi:N5-carboxyaminoimidazole ribonucleotide mutase [Thermosipho melanesiensis]|uniref:N5-carboxyaminoimidazole ribonucleotide mutase n=2 Tax=Thermosipho melanesiensis TaxID=46541 RepID=A6LMD4_THEM4|nr:5-(carboxyamino)imidazole ribonucleotide mutase [Thermosipho melanesiensis]ABR31085.1 phosphoribosylaminoimidazole carboxylase, catalytic subunit [Thermosipho melanesiensis BI429]APT74180.1 N5-carboxyaminoimidazole ribonucleotide mutase [Thermosipho melanesiensis]OOC36124.1 N5-carboxyaminoimidazole ribonucleotide mutase [Thermosipho melanesiensis]OOC36941.1 N5-carboxyaminoimidazole ribonucleotide mutase [Thermosipho melanesiensis]OOC37693.1 N5-carboxyaminoimidazole ribonucleotide mutase [Th
MIAVIAGSKSDSPVVDKVVSVLENFGVSYRIKYLSAHRTPKLLEEFIDECEKGGVKVYIAVAGGAAHLPGVVASKTVKPVIGVPVKSEDLGGLDSLLSIVQMPNDIPVATVGINRGKNAAILAIEMLALDNKELSKKLKEFRSKLVGKYL